MKRNVSLEEISDGKLYTANDMVKADCLGCKGCSACCHGMGDTIVLDPYDVYRLTAGLSVTLETLLQRGAELHVVDGLILPSLSMQGEAESCFFLNEEGRCSIHPYRPGICRLFPLGRVYEDGTFHYFLQTGECVNTARAKVKVSKWLDTPQLKSYEEFVCDWHYLLKDLEQRIMLRNDEGYQKKLDMELLQIFYLSPYHTDEDFYEQYTQRRELFQKNVIKEN